ncbi:MAG TPA: hypothetical protein VG407_16460 [Caulobacteraceae bacterium]|jgi:hypothetical protein|nr:hypothetical protein [Caulobacteraceae bacterium]
MRERSDDGGVTAVPPTPPASQPASQPTPPPEPTMGDILKSFTAREMLLMFTAGWLGGQGVIALLFTRYATWPERIVGGAELAAAILWFIPGLRQMGFGAMLGVLLIAALHQISIGQLPGAIIFYVVVVGYLALEEIQRRPAANK